MDPFSIKVEADASSGIIPNDGLSTADSDLFGPDWARVWRRIFTLGEEPNSDWTVDKETFITTGSSPPLKGINGEGMRLRM